MKRLGWSRRPEGLPPTPARSQLISRAALARPPEQMWKVEARRVNNDPSPSPSAIQREIAALELAKSRAQSRSPTRLRSLTQLRRFLFCSES